MVTKKNKGITIVNLIVAIIILLILAGVSVSFISREEGLLARTNYATELYNNRVIAQDEETKAIINDDYTPTGADDTEPDINIIFTVTPDGWANSVQVAISTTENNSTIKYSYDNSTWTDYTNPLEINENKTIYAKLGENGTPIEKQIGSIDTLAPNNFEITDVANDSKISVVERTETSITIAGIAHDEGETTDPGVSGVVGYKYAIAIDDNDNNDENDNYNWTVIIPVNSGQMGGYKFSNLTPETKYKFKIIAVDAAGNETETEYIPSRTISTLSSVPYLITEDPNITFAKRPSTWTNGTVNVEITRVETDEYTLQYRIAGSETWTNYTSAIPVTDNNTVIEVRLADLTNGVVNGDPTRVSKTVANVVDNIDKLAPASFNMEAVPGEIEIKVVAPQSITDAEATATSGSSGFAGYSYKIDNGNWTELTEEPVHVFSNIDRLSTHTVSMRIYDNAGNYVEATNGNASVTEINIEKSGQWNNTAKVNTPDVSKLPTETTKFAIWYYNEKEKIYKEILTNGPLADWYDYDNGKWVNIKSTANNLEAYWVWIPRFAYKLPESDTPVEIQTMFLKGTSNEGYDGTVAYFTTDTEITTNGTGLYKDATAEAKASNVANRRWIVHPAFWWDNNSDGIMDEGEQLAGIWVAKYEASSTNPGASETISDVVTITGGGDTTNLSVQVKPSVTSWRYISLANSFAVTRAMQDTGGVIGTTTGNTSIDTHMSKNLEWGSVAVLSQSKYGIFNPNSATGANGDGSFVIYSNSNNSYITGTSAIETNGQAQDDSELPRYNAGNGPKASTTGTIYGIYDMAGGANENVMAIEKKQNGDLPNLGFTAPLRKYYDLYDYEVWTGDQSQTYENNKIGDLIAELHPYYNTSNSSWRTWNNDGATHFSGNGYYLTRGGDMRYSGSQGIFASNRKTTMATEVFRSFRPVLITSIVPSLEINGNITVTLSDNNYHNTSTNGPIMVTLSTTETGFTLQYTTDGINWNNYTSPIPVNDNNTTIGMRLYDSASGKAGTPTTYTVTNIDKLAPLSFTYEVIKTTANSITVRTNAVDAPATATSGQSNISFEYGKHNGTLSSTSDGLFTITGLTVETLLDIDVYAVDEAGNRTAGTRAVYDDPIVLHAITSYYIYNQDDLEALRDRVNGGYNFANENVYLMADIDLGGDENDSDTWWEPIGSYSTNDVKPFSGTFEGNEHKISGLYEEYNTSSSKRAAFFTIIDGATIRNLEIEGVIKNNVKSFLGAGFAGFTWNECSIINCINSVDITGYENDGILGGFIARVGAYHTSNVLIESCINKGNINDGSTVGGLVGLAEDDLTIISSYNEGVINTSASRVGGLIGKAGPYASDVREMTITIENSYNTGVITATSVVGGIIGLVGQNPTTLRINNCYNTGDIIANSGTTNRYLGGILGYRYTTYPETTIEILNSYNTGNITANDNGNNSYCSGIIGYGPGNNNSILNCYNLGNITGKYVAGVGTLNRNVTINNVYNAGAVSGTTISTGIIYSTTSGTTAPNVKNTYYINTNPSGFAGTITTCDATSMTQAQMQSQAFADTLNDNITSTEWNSWLYEANEYPKFSGVPPLVRGQNVTFTTSASGNSVTTSISTTVEGYTLQYSINGGAYQNYSGPIPISNNNAVIKARLYDSESERAGRAETYTATMVNAPKLSVGMIPVKYVDLDGAGSGTEYGWKICAQNDPDWYSYGDKEWANVMLCDGRYNTSTPVGTEVAIDELGSMFVWIPRYAYKIRSGYHSSTTGEIDIKFLNGMTNTTYDNVSTVEYNATTTNNYQQFPNGYVVHPAFINDVDKGGWISELTGIWVSKFEAGYPMSGAQYDSTSKTLDNMYYPVFKGQRYSYDGYTIGNLYLMSEKMTSNGNPYGLTSISNSHMIKNSEWGAVAYLSTSSYGKESEIYPNNINYNGGRTNINESSVYGLTGYSADTADRGGNNVSGEDIEDTITGSDSYTSYVWYSTNGVNASTTGNQTGIYDMSGGYYEYTAGTIPSRHSYINTYGGTEFSSTESTNKITVYPLGNSTSSDTDISRSYSAFRSMYGDAIWETSFQIGGNYSWNGDVSDEDTGSSQPFFLRGHSFNTKNQTGVFAFADTGSNGTSKYGTRAVLAVETVPSLTSSNITFDYSTANWTNQNVIVTLTVPDEVKGTNTLRYKIGANGTWEDYNSINKISVPANSTVYAALYDGTNYGTSATGTVTKIDKTPPTVTSQLAEVSRTTTSIYVTTKVQDTASGMGKIIWYYKKASDNDWTSTPTSYQAEGPDAGAVIAQTKSKNFTSLTAGTTYQFYAEVYDVAGNMVTSKSASDPLVISTVSTSVNANTTFSTEYGTIDVIWLSGTTNTRSATPNAPVLSGMTPVKWTTTSTGWNATPVTTTESDTAWYSYKAVSSRNSTTNHTNDNTTSMWANAKNTTAGGDSYFVWIPRFAYRITYYASETSTTPTGYYDGNGMWRASDGNLRCALDDGAETVTYNGRKYIVHPAFCSGTKYQNGTTNKANPYDLGEWSSNIQGFWVAKYEMSRTGATDSSAGSGINTTFISVPNVQSARSINIGNMYTVAKAYDSSKESHMMKNSEWGAVAYLTHSQFGRNGNEIDINNSSTYITGNGGGSTSAEAAEGTTNAFNTKLGAKASTTGNIYGIYDMSGGGWENMAAFNNTDTNMYESTYGSTFAATKVSEDTQTINSSDQYATKYYNTTTRAVGNAVLYSYGKIGDATKEVNKAGIYDLSNTSNIYNWFDGLSSICYSGAPFFGRGGHYNRGVNAATFFTGNLGGVSNTNAAFRVVLCP